MFFSRTKTQNLFAATILVCAAVLCCKAEAAPKKLWEQAGRYSERKYRDPNRQNDRQRDLLRVQQER